jgi:hypothetical protein
MYINIPQPQAIFRQTVAEFDGPDPWDRNRMISWMLVLYQMGHAVKPIEREYTPAELKQGLPRAHVLGLFSRATNRCLLMPHSLTRHWQENRVTTEMLPHLLFKAEAARFSDFELIPVELHHRTGGIVTLSLGVTFMIGVGVLLMMNRLEPAIMCGFFGVMMLGFSIIMFSMEWWAKRKRNRNSEQWLLLAQQ